MLNALEAVDLVYEAMEEQAIIAFNPVERRFRDVCSTGSHPQRSRQGFDVTGTVLMGIYPRPTPLL